MDVAPRGIARPTLYEPQMIERGNRPASVPFGLPLLLERGVAHARVCRWEV